MTVRRIHRKSDRTPEQTAELKAFREEVQRTKPGIDDPQFESPMLPLGEVLMLHRLAQDLKRERERQNLTLAQVAELTEIDESALSRLETGRSANPTVQTLARVAAALGKRIDYTLCDLGAKADG